jgi:hypothetical protein
VRFILEILKASMTARKFQKKWAAVFFSPNDVEGTRDYRKLSCRSQIFTHSSYIRPKLRERQRLFPLVDKGLINYNLTGGNLHLSTEINK